MLPKIGPFHVGIVEIKVFHQKLENIPQMLSLAPVYKTGKSFSPWLPLLLLMMELFLKFS